MKSITNKGSANMWWIIIAAIMALVVMIILMVIFSGGTDKANTGLFDCASKGGVCDLTEEDCKVTGGAVYSIFSCKTPGEICCLKGVKKKSGEVCGSGDDCQSGNCVGAEGPTPSGAVSKGTCS